MKNLVYSFLIVGLFWGGNIQAQTIPGYIGMKNLAGIESAFGLSMGAPYFKPGIIMNNSFTLERVIGRKSTFFCYASYSSSSYFADGYRFTYDDGSTETHDRLHSFDPTDRYFKGQVLSLGAGLKFYRKSYIAPIGRFFKIKMGYVKFGMKNWEEGIAGTYYFVPANQPGYITETVNGSLKLSENFYSGLLLSLGFGKTVPINDRIIFEAGNNFNFNLSTDFSFGEFGGAYVDETGNVTKDYYKMMYNLAKWRYLFDFYVGLKIAF